MVTLAHLRRLFSRMFLSRPHSHWRSRRILSRPIGNAWVCCEQLEQRVLLSGAPLLRDFTVMSQNLYLGTDLNPIITALSTGDSAEIVSAVSTGWQQVVATDFEERAETLADQILDSQPTLIGLQEVALWQTGTAFDPAPAMTVEYDFLEILLDELTERGLDYAPVSVVSNFSAEVPGFTDPVTLEDIRLTDRDVILARTDLKRSELKLSNSQAENFQTNLVFPLPPELGGGLEITRGWTAIDVKIRGKEFRVINTHLELEVPEVGPLLQLAQAQELLVGPANTDLPVILLGDFNSRADQNGEVYQLMLQAGFSDVWTQTHPGEEGGTCCHDADLRNDVIDFDEGRIDWILYRGEFLPVDMDRFNDELDDRTPTGLWASDHAGLVATLIVNPLPPVVRRFAHPVIFTTSTNLGFDRLDLRFQHRTEVLMNSSPNRAQRILQPHIDHPDIANPDDMHRDEEPRTIVFQKPLIDDLLAFVESQVG